VQGRQLGYGRRLADARRPYENEDAGLDRSRGNGQPYRVAYPFEDRLLDSFVVVQGVEAELAPRSAEQFGAIPRREVVVGQQRVDRGESRVLRLRRSRPGSRLDEGILYGPDFREDLLDGLFLADPLEEATLLFLDVGLFLLAFTYRIVLEVERDLDAFPGE
jgi:hypothetical protein